MNKDETIEKRAGFTQGEWTIRECPQGGHYEGGEDPFTISADGRFIASIKLQSRNTQANARLIANSPAMYDQCRMLENLLENLQEERATHELTSLADYEIKSHDRVDEKLAQVRELLAKVDGMEG